MEQTRISSATYRSWTLPDWLARVEPLGANSLSDWALLERTTYNAARLLGRHRAVADALGWPSRLPSDGAANLTSDEFAARFAARGAKTPSDMWRINNDWCKRLRRQGRFDEVRQMLNAQYVLRQHPATLQYFLDACGRYDFFEAWICADVVAAATARRHGFLDEVRNRSRRRPAAFTTTGGPVHSITELVVARLLEHNGIQFDTEPDYPFNTPGRRHHAQRADFRLHRDVWVEVWMHAMDANARSTRVSRYLVRRQLKTGLCRRYGLHLVSIEGSLLFRANLAIFVEHCTLVLQHATGALVTDIEPREFLALESPSDHVRNGPRRALEVIHR
jgi:hypothetical protein